MKSVLRILALAAVACALASPALAQTVTVAPKSDPIGRIITTTTLPATVPPVATAPAAGQGSAIAAPTPPTSSFGPIPDAGSLSLGTLGGQVLTWLAAAFGAPAGAYLVLILSRLLQGVGVSVDDAMRARLQALAVNGLNFGASRIASAIDGKVPVNLKNQLVADAVAYVQLHGSDVLKKLGADPMADATIKAIKARIEGALVDPNVPISISPTAVQVPADPADPQQGAPLAFVVKAIEDGFSSIVAHLHPQAPAAPSPLAPQA